MKRVEICICATGVHKYSSTAIFFFSTSISLLSWFTLLICFGFCLTLPPSLIAAVCSLNDLVYAGVTLLRICANKHTAASAAAATTTTAITLACPVKSTSKNLWYFSAYFSRSHFYLPIFVIVFFLLTLLFHYLKKKCLWFYLSIVFFCIWPHSHRFIKRY